MTRRHASAVMCVLAMLLLAGCGGGTTTTKPSDPAQIEQTLRTYLHAQAQGDGITACGLLSAAAQNQLIGLVLSAGKGLIPTRPSCADAVALARAAAGAQLLSALESARVEQIRLTGNRARAQVVDGTQFKPQQVTLEKSGGQWKIAGVPSLGG